MPVWLPPTAAEQPDVTLMCWGAFEVLVPELGEPTIHVAGLRQFGDGRVSSPIVKVDAQRRSVVTRSGRVYRLVGSPGLSGDALYVWQRWLGIWSATVLSDAAPALVHRFAGEEASDGGAPL